MTNPDTRPDGLLTQFLRFALVLLFLFVFFYGLLCAIWTFDIPLHLNGVPITTALQWHIAPFRLWLSDQFTLAQLAPAVKQMYSEQFGSNWWLVGLATACALAISGAFEFDYFAITRNGNEDTPMNRRHIHLACLAYLGIVLFCLGLSALLNLLWPGRGQEPRMLGTSLMLLGIIVSPIVWLVRRFIKPARPGAGMSDVREIAKQLRKTKDFHPEDHFQNSRGCFLGMNANQKPIYIPWRTLRTTHTQVLGMTGTGKGVASAVLLAQCARAQESIIIFDPKDDSFMPGVLDRAAREAGIPFTLVDLNANKPRQVNPFQGATADEAYELLVAAFGLKAQGNNADIYKLEEQLCAQEVAQLAHTSISWPDIVERYEPRMTAARDAGKKDEVKGRKFWLDLLNLASLTPIQTSQGPDLKAAVEKPGLLYIVGSMTDLRVIQTQKMLLYRIMQLISSRDRAADQYACLMLDELKYLLSPQVLTMLSTVRDRKCHILLAHQSLGDLRDSTELDGKAVVGAVVENTGLKLIYRVNSPETAKWASDLSGKITAYTSSQGMDRHILEHPGAWRETQRNLIEESVLLQLPTGLGVVYGVDGPAQLVHICPLQVGTNPGITQEFADETAARKTSGLEKLAEATASKEPFRPLVLANETPAPAVPAPAIPSGEGDLL